MKIFDNFHKNQLKYLQGSKKLYLSEMYVLTWTYLLKIVEN